MGISNPLISLEPLVYVTSQPDNIHNKLVMIFKFQPLDAVDRCLDANIITK